MNAPVQSASNLSPVDRSRIRIGPDARVHSLIHESRTIATVDRNPHLPNTEVRAALKALRDLTRAESPGQRTIPFYVIRFSELSAELRKLTGGASPEVRMATVRTYLEAKLNANLICKVKARLAAAKPAGIPEPIQREWQRHGKALCTYLTAALERPLAQMMVQYLKEENTARRQSRPLDIEDTPELDIVHGGIVHTELPHVDSNIFRAIMAISDEESVRPQGTKIWHAGATTFSPHAMEREPQAMRFDVHKGCSNEHVAIPDHCMGMMKGYGYSQLHKKDFQFIKSGASSAGYDFAVHSAPVDNYRTIENPNRYILRLTMRRKTPPITFGQPNLF